MEQDAASEGPLRDECRVIAENALYTAQAHYVLAERASFRAKILLLVPSIVAAASGLLVALGFPPWIGGFAALSGSVSGVASLLGVDREALDHKYAANLMTSLRHDARALADSYWLDLSHDELQVEVRRLHDRYNAYIQSLETTDKKSFEAARERIKRGTFEPDFRKADRTSQEKESK